MKGTRILIAAPQRGVFEDVVVSGTPKPGTVMEIDAAVEPVGNVFQYQAYGVTAYSSGLYVENDGDRKAIAVLVEMDHEAALYSTAYVSGTRGRVYFPAMGEWLNMLVEAQAGTGDLFAIGDEFMVDNGVGMLLAADTDAEAHPFTCLETVAAISVDTWVWCRFNGAGGA